MAISQVNKVNPPIVTDLPNLVDYSKNIQGNMVQLFQAAHSHQVLPSNPATLSGAIQTVSIVDTGTEVYLVVKTSRGWFRSPTFTALPL